MAPLGNSIMPCAACKILRRRCTKDCAFLPYFPPSEPEKFVAVHRIFGASNISKLLQEISVDDREDAVISMVFEATARLRDPVYGCAGLIASLQKQIYQLQSELNAALAQTVVLGTQVSDAFPGSTSTQASSSANNMEEKSFNNLYYYYYPQFLSECNNYMNSFDALLLEPHLQDSCPPSESVVPEPCLDL